MGNLDFDRTYYLDDTAQIVEMDRRRTRNRFDKLEAEIQELRQDIAEFRDALLTSREEES